MRYYLFIFFVFAIHDLHSQIVQEKSLELLLINSNSQHGVVPVGEKGIVVFNEKKNLESVSKRKWEITLLDTLLKFQWNSYFESDYNFKITHVKSYDGFIYLLFQDMNIPMKSAFFIRGNVSENRFELFELRDFLPSKIISFEILGNSLFLIGENEKRPTILKFQYGDPRPHVLRGLFIENNEFVSAELVPEHNLIQIITRMKKRRGENSLLLVKQFDELGNVRKDIRIESNKGYNLINCKAKTDANGRICIIGTYSHSNSKLSNGIFTLVHNGEYELPAYYYEYTNLHRFFNYLPLKEKEKMIKKYARKKSSSKGSKYAINQKPQEIIRTENGWIFLGELVKYTEKNTRVYGNMWPMEYRQYSHALLLGIDLDGKLMWDESFSLNDLSSKSNSRQTYLNYRNGRMVLFYLNKKNILYKVIDKEEETNDFGTLELNASYVKFSYDQHKISGQILPWYSNKFVAFGSFFSEGNKEENKKIFYLNKIAVLPTTIAN